MKYKSLRTDTVSARQWWHSASENWRGKTFCAISISERQVKQEGSQRRRGRAGRTSGGDVCENVAVFNGGGGGEGQAEFGRLLRDSLHCLV